MTTCFVLASKSPARLRMLRSAGIEPVVIASGADERRLHGEDAITMTARLCHLKAHSVIESGALDTLPIGQSWWHAIPSSILMGASSANLTLPNVPGSGGVGCAVTRVCW